MTAGLAAASPAIRRRDHACRPGSTQSSSLVKRRTRVEPWRRARKRGSGQAVTARRIGVRRVAFVRSTDGLTFSSESRLIGRSDFGQLSQVLDSAVVRHSDWTILAYRDDAARVNCIKIKRVTTP